jgi:hypothetical protein
MDLDVCRKSVQEYKNIYFEMYGHQPPERCIESFCHIRSIPWPIPRDEEVIPEPFLVPLDMKFGCECEE